MADLIYANLAILFCLIVFNDFLGERLTVNSRIIRGNLVTFYCGWDGVISEALWLQSVEFVLV